MLRHDSQIGGAQVNGNNTDRPEGDGDGMLVPLTIGMRSNLGKDAARKGAAMWRAVTNRYPKAIFMICLLGYDEDPREADGANNPRLPVRAYGTPFDPALWDKLTFSRRPGWFSGAETLLESFVTMTIGCQQIEAALRKAGPVAGARYHKLTRHRRSVVLTASLATKLKLAPSSRLDGRTPQDGELPVA